MELKKLLLFSGLTLGLGMSANAQIWNANQPDMGIWGPPKNTGLAISPNMNIHAAVHDDGFGTYFAHWIQGSTVTDIEMNAGDDPDVAYFGDASALVVSYEMGGDIYVDEYMMVTPFPADYALTSTNYISPGTYSNIDVNSSGLGILTWEQGGDIWASTFNFPGFAPGPAVLITAGTQPDIVVFDDNITAGLTFVDPNGSLHIFTLDYATLQGGAPGITQVQGYDWLGNTAAYPRIASQRNLSFGPADDFTVVAEYSNFPSFHEVYGVFSTGGVISSSPVQINMAFAGCTSFEPRPVVAYDRSEVHVAWSQDYIGGCSGLAQSAPNFESDVLLSNYDFMGNLLFSSAPGIPPFAIHYEEVNFINSNFGGKSRTSIATEYDGFYNINMFNYEEGLLYNDPGDLLWKQRTAGNPTFMNEEIRGERGNNFSLVSSPVDQTIEVVSESDDVASFQLLDNAGRVVELKDISGNDNLYSIDISHLSGGMYFLHCSSAAGQEILRVLQVNK